MRAMPTKKCEDCGRTTASCGIPGEKSKQRWCRECSVNYPGAVPHIPPSKLCIICGKIGHRPRSHSPWVVVCSISINGSPYIASNVVHGGMAVS